MSFCKIIKLATAVNEIDKLDLNNVNLFANKVCGDRRSAKYT